MKVNLLVYEKIVPIEKEVKRIGKNREEITKIISYKLKFIISTKFMASSLSNLVNNLPEGIHKIKFKYGHDNKKCKMCGIKYKDCECCLEYTNVKDDLKEHKCSYCNRNYQKKFDENLKKWFGATYEFYNHEY